MDNPYLQPQRLQNIIAAITALAKFEDYKLDVAGWTYRITGVHPKAGDAAVEKWGTLFKQHPEFFRTSDDGRVSLVWRRQAPRTYGAAGPLAPGATPRVRAPLEGSEMTALIGIAVDLHERALQQEQAARWWVQLVPAGLAFIGALLGSATIFVAKMIWG